MDQYGNTLSARLAALKQLHPHAVRSILRLRFIAMMSIQTHSSENTSVQINGGCEYVGPEHPMYDCRDIDICLCMETISGHGREVAPLVIKVPDCATSGRANGMFDDIVSVARRLMPQVNVCLAYSLNVLY
jgi:hypothetical protein